MNYTNSLFIELLFSQMIVECANENKNRGPDYGRVQDLSSEDRLLHWNPVNTATKGTRRSVRIIRVSVLSVLIRTPRGHAEVSLLSGVRIKCVNMDTKGTCRSVRIIQCPY